MMEFTNRVAMALTNAFPPQLYSDPSTPTNPAVTANITAISVDAYGVVTVTTSTNHGLTSSGLPSNVLIAGVSVTPYNGAFPVIEVLSTVQYKVRNLAAIGSAAGSNGTSTVTATAITSSFVPAFPDWSASTQYDQGSVIGPTVGNPGNYYFEAQQNGDSGATEPSAWPQQVGQQVADGGQIWQNMGLINSAAPPPPGAAHLFVYAGSLWALNTSTINTSTGIDGPCSLRMSDVNNPTSWNPINQAFLDKDDGTVGQALSSFTITAQGIPPEGSLVAFKNYAGYQIVGVFGSSDFAIQKIKSAMGCLAPLSTKFVPGFGICRFTHLGFANFDGVEDKVISEEIRPYLFVDNEFQDSDITVLDSSWQGFMCGFLTAQPGMYCIAIPIGNSGGELTRIMCFDLVLKAWAAPVNLPWPISSANQFVTTTSNPVSVLGGYYDGCLSRWQASDQEWDVGATGARSPSFVNFAIKFPDAFSQMADQKLFWRRIAVKGIVEVVLPAAVFQHYIDGVLTYTDAYTFPNTGDFIIFASVMTQGQRFSTQVSGSGQIQIDRADYHVAPKEVGASMVIS